MKKILAMLVVLGLASFANASIMNFNLVPTPGQSGHGFSPDDPLLPSEWVDLDIVYTGNMPLWSTGDLYLTITGTGEWCTDQDPFPLEEVWTWHEKFDEGYEPFPGFPLPGLHRLQRIDDQNLKIDIGGATGLNPSIGIQDGETLFDHLNVHCTGPGEIVVTLVPSTSTGGMVGLPTYWDGQLQVGDPEAVGSSITIYNIPEPMTMALLGIGGLALIRRRR